jgi:hypothetical protein
MAIAKSMTTGQRHKGEGHMMNLYETHPAATRALMKQEQLPYSIWEASCGPGAIVRVLRAAGHEVLATDQEDYHSPDQDLANFDFTLQEKLPYPGIDAIVQNPPFNRQNEFIRKSLQLCRMSYFLLRVQYLEGTRRDDIQSKLARVHVFKNRLPLMHRAGWNGKKATNTQAFAWFVFDREHTGPAHIHWMKWEESPFDPPIVP